MDTKQLSLFDSNANDTRQPVSPFESIKHIDAEGEYWLARELMHPLGYGSWQFFLPVIDKARNACEHSGGCVADQFMDTHELITHGKGGQRSIGDVRLTRYACYLIAMNGDSRKTVIANAQTYFATKTRERELDEQHQRARLDGIETRHEFTAAARESHITHTPDYGGLTNATYQILFGAAMKELAKTLGLTPTQAARFRDHISTLALDAIRMAEDGAAAEFGGLSGMESKAQIETVCEYARIVAPVAHQIATKAHVDLLSGRRLISSASSQETL